MAGIRSVISVLRFLGLISWRDIQSFRSIAGQNFFLFVLFVALQPESAELFGLLLAAAMLFPLSTDPMQKIPAERRASWPICTWQWGVVRLGTLALSPIVWLALFLVARGGWLIGALVLLSAIALQAIAYLAKRMSGRLSTLWLLWIPAPPGTIGCIMRLQWREMLRTLDPYIAFALMACTEIFKLSGKALDPAAARILALVVVLALSTQTQVLLGIDGLGAARYRQLPIRGWQILLAKDLAFLVLLGILVLPFDPAPGLFGGLAVLAIGHHHSVLKPAVQLPWRFTSGALLPDGLIQIAALFSVGLAIETEGPWLAPLCVLAWFASLLFYGWRWDRSVAVGPLRQ